MPEEDVRSFEVEAHDGQRIRVQVENVVVSASLSGELDLEAVEKALPGAGPARSGRFPGIAYKAPGGSILFFKSGAMICAGYKSLGEALGAIRRALAELRQKGLDVRLRRHEVVNIVACGDFGGPLNVAEAVASLRQGEVEVVKFSPPFLIARLKGLGKRGFMVFNMFERGRFILPGRSVEEMREAVRRMYRVLVERGLLARVEA